MEKTISKDKIDLFETMPIPKAVFKLALPTILAMLVAVFYSLADTYFVSLLNDPIETAAVTLASTVTLLFNAVNNIFGVGGSSLFTRFLGSKEYDKAKNVGTFSIYGAIISGIIFSLIVLIFNTDILRIVGTDEFNYFVTKRYMFYTVILGATPAILNTVIGQIIKGEGLALHASFGMMSGCLLNIILDPFFILPQFLNMGAEGAGLATLISNCFACLYYVVLLSIIKRGKTILTFNPKYISLNKTIIFGIFAVGVPAAIQNILNVTGSTVLNNYASIYGSTCVSAIGIAHKLCNISLYIAMGISSGITPLISYNYASKNHKRMKDTIIFTLKIVLPMMLVLCGLMEIFASNIIKTFMDNEEVIKYGTIYIKEFAIAQPFLAIDFSAVGIFQATGKGRNALIFAILRKIILEIPALYILNKIYPLYGLGFAQPIAEIILAILAVLIIRRFFRQLGI